MTAKLLAQRHRVVQKLPPIEEVLRGGILERAVRCGQPTCRCASGARHAATVFTVSFPGGRTEQISLPAAVLPTVRRWVANYQRWWEIIERVSAINRDLLRAQRREGRERPLGRRSKRRSSS
ncbi:MAG: DUF6788 family protein [Burkholderiales bacterium]